MEVLKKWEGTPIIRKNYTERIHRLTRIGDHQFREDLGYWRYKISAGSFFFFFFVKACGNPPNL